MPDIIQSKVQINLSDYPLETDVAIRVFASQASHEERRIIDALIHGPLCTSMATIAEDAEVDEEEVAGLLEKSGSLAIATLQKGVVHVNKEKRLLQEIALKPYESAFEPTLGYLQKVLSKVPIHILPLWYNLSKTSDSIQLGVLDKFFATTRVYEQYLKYLVFDDPILTWTKKHLLASPDKRLLVSDIQEKFKLTDAELEKNLIKLEFYLVAFASGGDQRTVTLLGEWRSYLDRSSSLPSSQSVNLPKRKAPSQNKDCSALFTNGIDDLIDEGYTLKEVQRAMRCLKHLSEESWLQESDFIRQAEFDFFSEDSLPLRRKGGRWEYETPPITKKDQELINHSMEKATAAGAIQKRVHEGKSYLRITPEGTLLLQEL